MRVGGLPKYLQLRSSNHFLRKHSVPMVNKLYVKEFTGKVS